MWSRRSSRLSAITAADRAIGTERAAVSHILDAAQVPRDGVVVVHSAFSGLSRDGFRAEAFIDALVERLRHGTLLMPAMTWRNVTPAAPDWDERQTRSHVGILTEIFRTRYAETRSIHPTHSVSALGPAARELVADHQRDDTPCSPRSPWGRLAACNAYILLLGIGFETCTALHHAEEMVAPALYLKPPAEAVSYRCVARDGAVFSVRMRHHLRLNRDFPQYDGRLERQGKLATGTLGATRWRLVSARTLIDDSLANLRARPDAHIAAIGP